MIALFNKNEITQQRFYQKLEYSMFSSYFNRKTLLDYLQLSGDYDVNPIRDRRRSEELMLMTAHTCNNSRGICEDKDIKIIADGETIA